MARPQRKKAVAKNPNPDPSIDPWDIPDPKDWFTSRSGYLSRSQLLALAFVGKKIIQGLEPGVSKAAYRDGMESAIAYTFTRARSLENLEWDKVRVVLRNMKKKYAKDTTGFTTFLQLARGMWREDNKTA